MTGKEKFGPDLRGLLLVLCNIIRRAGIQSGGNAKMVVVDADHPDIETYIGGNIGGRACSNAAAGPASSAVGEHVFRARMLNSPSSFATTRNWRSVADTDAIGGAGVYLQTRSTWHLVATRWRFGYSPVTELAP